VFVVQVETASLPVKVQDMQLSSMNESGDSMSLHLRISASYLGSAAKADKGSRPEQQSHANAVAAHI
jgi:hypothetical protein